MVLCQSCEEEREGKWKCAGCKSKGVYCSKACQIADWPHHIFDCYVYRGKTVPLTISPVHVTVTCFLRKAATGFNKDFTPYNQMIISCLVQILSNKPQNSSHLEGRGYTCPGDKKSIWDSTTKSRTVLSVVSWTSRPSGSRTVSRALNKGHG